MGHPLDRANAFSALLELDPEFKRVPLAEQSRRITTLLQAYWTEDGEGSVWTFAEAWWRKRQGEASS
jgi:hypothetical protein